MDNSKSGMTKTDDKRLEADYIRIESDEKSSDVAKKRYKY